MQNNILNAALEYLEMGLSIIPIRPKDKRPLIPWEEHQRRLATVGEAESWFDKWPDANIALVTGKLSNVVAIDADSPGRVKWLQETFPTSISQKTGNGMHGFFKPNNGPVKTQVGVLDKVDVRGDGGYVVIAPSIHETGQVYTLQYAEGFDAWDDLADFPYNIFPSDKKTDIKAPVTREPAAQGERNATLTRLAGRYCKAGLDYDQVLVLCANDNKTYSPPLPDRDVKTICKSIYGKDQRQQQDTGNVEVVTPEDAQKINMSLQIPDEILHPGGLIDLGLTGLLQQECPDIPQFLLPVLLSHVANAIAGKIRFHNKWPNLYNVKVGGTSTGKSESDKAMRFAVQGIGSIESFYGPDDISSGAGLYKALEGTPMCLVVLDEICDLFKNYNKANPVQDGINKAVLKLFSMSGQGFHQQLSGEARTKESACLSILGNTTPLIFDSISLEDFVSGKMQRFDFWVYDGPPKYRSPVTTPNDELKEFCELLKAIRGSNDPRVDPNSPAGVVGTCYDCAIGSDCLEESNKLSEEITLAGIKAYETGQDQDIQGIVSRQYDLTFKYAMVHMGFARDLKDLYEPMVLEDFIFGKKVAKLLSDWKIDILRDKVTAGDFDRECGIFKDAILKANRARRKYPDFKFLMGRNRELRGWSEEQSARNIKMLLKRGEIITAEKWSKKEQRDTTRYLLIKK